MPIASYRAVCPWRSATKGQSLGPALAVWPQAPRVSVSMSVKWA